MPTFTKSEYETISELLHCSPEDIQIIDNKSGGMTNTSVRICAKGHDYIVRKPGKGSDKLVDRNQERSVYAFLRNVTFDDITIAVLPDGMKISKYIANARNCNPQNYNDVAAVMIQLKDFHDNEFKPDVKYFNLLAKLDEYRELACIRNHTPRPKYEDVYNRCLQVAAWIERLPRKTCLCQIDCNPDNAIFTSYSVFPRLIDWEYAGLQDPHLDVAMFAVYCGYDIRQFNDLINMYFLAECDADTRYKIYGYAALAGMLWYNWCMYKEKYGIMYGEYTESQFKFADEYSELVLKYLQSKE